MGEALDLLCERGERGSERGQAGYIRHRNACLGFAAMLGTAHAYGFGHGELWVYWG